MPDSTAIEKITDKQVHHKTFSFKINEATDIKSKNGAFGKIIGYASTYGNIDLVGDMIMPGAFDESIKSYVESGDPIPMHYQHAGLEIIGGFPANLIESDGNGLLVQGDINLDVQRGRETYSLAKQKVLPAMSIGYYIEDAEEDRGVFKLIKLTLVEISIVGRPADPKARITAVKSFEESIKGMKDIENYLKTPHGLNGIERKILISKIKEFSRKRDASDDVAVKDVKAVSEDDGARDAAQINGKLDSYLICEKLDEIIKQTKH